VPVRVPGEREETEGGASSLRRVWGGGAQPPAPIYVLRGPGRDPLVHGLEEVASSFAHGNAGAITSTRCMHLIHKGGIQAQDLGDRAGLPDDLLLRRPRSTDLSTDI
jgi:hypothetical protein